MFLLFVVPVQIVEKITRLEKTKIFVAKIKINKEKHLVGCGIASSLFVMQEIVLLSPSLNHTLLTICERCAEVITKAHTCCLLYWPPIGCPKPY